MIRLILRQGFRQMVVGLVIGLLIAGALSNVLGFLMFGANPRDPLVFGSVLLLTVCVGRAAGFVPAQRATGVDPNGALGAE